MLAKELAAFLAEEAMKTDLSAFAFGDMSERFESLRGYRLLPTGRTKNVTHLSLAEISAAILSIATVKPGYAGLAASVLKNLHPVGGIDASFQGRTTFGRAIESLLEKQAALDSLVEVRISDSEIYQNSHCRAAVSYHFGDSIKTAYYVGSLATSLLHPNAEKTFNPRETISSIVTEMVLYPQFFRRIANAIRVERSAPRVPVPVDPKDEDEEARKEERARRLGLRPDSMFINLGVDNQVTWPREETVVEFDGYRLILFPKTRENMTSIHIDLHGQRINSDEATTLVNRFLSLMTWCYDQFAVQQGGWSGNSGPAPVPKRNLGFITTSAWIFDRKVPTSDEARRALAIYREGRNAEQNNLISYAVLSYYKIFELRYPRKVRPWLQQNYGKLKQQSHLTDDISRFEKACGTEEPHEYLHGACRVAVAHASERYPSDPDDLHELRRLHEAARILRAIARQFIRDELGVSDCPFDGT